MIQQPTIQLSLATTWTTQKYSNMPSHAQSITITVTDTMVPLHLHLEVHIYIRSIYMAIPLVLAWKSYLQPLFSSKSTLYLFKMLLSHSTLCTIRRCTCGSKLAAPLAWTSCSVGRHTTVFCPCIMLHMASTCCGDSTIPSRFKFDSENMIAESFQA